ncbi:hypothetical protein BZG36_01240 [Bifiguratus adelaidae]|uniref:Uncharacterized protein n=1 Tax=Bifiguratus adelaidae TaxID=1938954 RepID=A0A261Y5U2_9FUNG|nr:hypothetical protein BZG36_01240 [Bifiguratus adelaidae]
MLKIQAIAAIALTLLATVRADGGQTVAIHSATDFCLMIPRDPAKGVAESEDDAYARCLNADTALSMNAQTLPDGFILSAYYATGDKYVQVTGKIDPMVIGLRKHDEGGQNDLHAPVGSACQGYASYVQLLEPDNGNFCIRCCHHGGDCPTGRSQYGCESVIPGQYESSSN